MHCKILLTAAVLVTSLTVTNLSLAAAANSEAEDVKTTLAFQEPIANAPGKMLTAVIVDYAPGAKSPSHRHGSAFIVGYVLLGAIRSQVNDGKAQVFQAGERFTEMPGDHHVLSENASQSEPAKLMAIFVVDKDQKELVTWD